MTHSFPTRRSSDLPPDPSMPTATAPLTARYAEELDAIRSQGLFKSERIITSPQSAEITLEDGRTVLNFCANNYLGLADHPAMIEAARAALDTHGFGMASVRFICATQDLPKRLEKRSEEHTSELQSIMRTSYAVFCLNKKTKY